MNIRCALLLVLVLPVTLVQAADDKQPVWFTTAMTTSGNAYRAMVTNISSAPNAVDQLSNILAKQTADSAEGRQARILVTRIKAPGVFLDLQSELEKYRREYPQGSRPGCLSGRLMQFVRLGPENKVVDERAGWNTNGFGNRPAFKKVEKYTDADVQAGIARNAAARQAVLERFLKFLDEGNADEQSGLVDTVYRLWGSNSYERRKEEPIADDLIGAVYKDVSRPLLVRYTAALSLPETRQQGVQNLMVNIVTNTDNKSEDLFNRALGYLESSGDANALAVLKTQTNGPAWKLQKIEKTSQVIEIRLSKK